MMTYLNQEIWFLDRDSKRVPVEYKSDAIFKDSINLEGSWSSLSQ